MMEVRTILSSLVPFCISRDKSIETISVIKLRFSSNSANNYRVKATCPKEKSTWNTFFIVSKGEKENYEKILSSFMVIGMEPCGAAE
jgi:hypothetical protein